MSDSNDFTDAMARRARGLALLRQPFPPHQISKLPKPTRAQTDALRSNPQLGIRCEECGGWHHRDVIHLDYVGHAALTDRLLEADPEWSWEPLTYEENGLPRFDSNGGLWIRLTICGVTRLGYGNAPQKREAEPGNREKEVIGDALRNSAMRFGAALELWHKGDLRVDYSDDVAATAGRDVHKVPDPRVWADDIHAQAVTAAEGGIGSYQKWFAARSAEWRRSASGTEIHSRLKKQALAVNYPAGVSGNA